MNGKTASINLITDLFNSKNSAQSVCPHYGCDFHDVLPTTPYCNNILYVCQSGFMVGTSAKKFSPSALLTRGMAVMVLYRLDGSPDQDYVKGFKDVHKRSYAARAITWASSNGMVSGYDDIMFGPDDYITKEQLALLFRNYAFYKGFDVSITASLDSYRDSKAVKSWAKTAMQWAIGTGLLSSKNPVKLDAMCRITRGEFTSMVQRFCDLYHI